MKQKISIAIADDFPALIKGMRYIIESADKTYTVTIEATDGDDLIRKLDTAKNKPDIVLLDISMPKKNGFEALAVIIKKWKGIKVIMQSMYFDEFNAIKAFRTGASAFISKEADPKEIALVLKNVIQHGYYYSTWIEDNILPNVRDSDYETTITPKEREFLEHICSDLTYAQIAELLGKSSRTIETYRDTLFQKLNVKSRTGLAIFAIKSGITRL